LMTLAFIPDPPMSMASVNVSAGQLNMP
jgi:hypothetical protein